MPSGVCVCQSVYLSLAPGVSPESEHSLSFYASQDLLHYSCVLGIRFAMFSVSRKHQGRAQSKGTTLRVTEVFFIGAALRQQDEFEAQEGHSWYLLGLCQEVRKNRRSSFRGPSGSATRRTTNSICLLLATLDYQF